jgi:ferritin
MKKIDQINKKTTYSPDTALIISKIIEKYGFGEKEDKIFNMLRISKNTKQEKEIFEQLPSRALARIVKNISEEKIPLTDLSNIIQKDLKITKKISDEIAKILEEEVLMKNGKFLKDKTKKTKNSTSAGSLIFKENKIKKGN